MTVVIDKKAGAYLARLAEPMYSRILNGLTGLTDDPPSGDILKLQGREFGYRLRVGGYRILYDQGETEITVYQIAPRGDVYKEE